MNKVIFIYWAQHFSKAPEIVRNCLLSWKILNPTWKVVELDDKNLKDYIDIEKEIPDINTKDITRTSYSDIIRVFLLDKYGGCWCDATTFCNQPLDDWLLENSRSGFFAFKMNCDRPLSTWFLYSEKDNYVMKTWKSEVIKYVSQMKKLGTTPRMSVSLWKRNKYDSNNYFWIHYLFGDLLLKDPKIKELFQFTPTKSAGSPHFIQNNGILGKVTTKTSSHIDELKSPLYKLTYRIDYNKFSDDCNLAYLYKRIE